FMDCPCYILWDKCGNLKSQNVKRSVSMLKIENITKRFGDHTAVDHLTLHIPEKELFGFLGGNGAGKTTTFRMILSLLDPTEGDIRWNDEKISYNKSHLIGYLPEERGLYPKLKVKEQLIYLAKIGRAHV